MLATVAGATAVLSAAVAAVPIFLSSAATEAVAVQADERCPPRTGGHMSYVPFGVGGEGGSFQVGDVPADPFPAGADALDQRVLTLDFDSTLDLQEVGAPGLALSVRVMARDGATDHVEILDQSPSGTSGPGVWVTDRVVDAAGVGPDDMVTIGVPGFGPAGEEAADPPQVRVVGVYRDLAGYQQDDNWCAVSAVLEPNSRGEPPPPLVLVDRATFEAVAATTSFENVRVAWEASLTDQDVTLTEADRLAARLAGIETFESRMPVVGDDVELVPESLATDLPFLTARARSIRAAVAGGVVPVAGFAALAGVGLVAVAASLWFDRRRREVALLVVRGVGPAAIGVKAVLELLVAVAAGGSVGLGLAYGSVRWLGPSSTLEPTAVRPR